MITPRALSRFSDGGGLNRVPLRFPHPRLRRLRLPALPCHALRLLPHRPRRSGASAPACGFIDRIRGDDARHGAGQARSGYEEGMRSWACSSTASS